VINLAAFSLGGWLFAHEDNGATEVALLCVCVCVRFITSVLDANIHVPSGDWLCLFAVGAGMGRLLGHGSEVPAHSSLGAGSHKRRGGFGLAAAHRDM
jgi:hypothetical protein